MGMHYGRSYPFEISHADPRNFLYSTSMQKSINSNGRKLWEKYKAYMSEDFARRREKDCVFSHFPQITEQDHAAALKHIITSPKRTNRIWTPWNSEGLQLFIFLFETLMNTNLVPLCSTAYYRFERIRESLRNDDAGHEKKPRTTEYMEK